MKRIGWMFTAAAMVLTMAFALPAVQAMDEPDNAAPDFTLKDHTGNEVSLADFGDDTVVVIEWINFKCPYVQRHHSDDFETMMTLAAEYKDRGVVWLAIDSSHFATQESAAKDVADNQLSYPILVDADGSVGQAYGAKTTPDMRIIKGGQVLYAGAIDNDKSGKLPAEQRVSYVRQALDQVLAGTPVTTPQTKPYGCGVKYKK